MPGDLEQGQEATIPFRVTSVHGDNATLQPNWRLVIQGLAVEVMYKAANSPLKFSNPADSALKSADCPTDVPATEGKRFDCQVIWKSRTTNAVALKVESATSSGQDLRVVSAHKD